MKADSPQLQATPVALPFKENLYYERIARLEREDPETFSVLSLPERYALAAYLDAKAKAGGTASVID